MLLLVVLRASNSLSRRELLTLTGAWFQRSQIKRENQIVSRSIKAIGLIYHLTGRVPMLIKQSHLEAREGL